MARINLRSKILGTFPFSAHFYLSEYDFGFTPFLQIQGENRTPRNVLGMSPFRKWKKICPITNHINIHHMLQGQIMTPNSLDSSTVFAYQNETTTLPEGTLQQQATEIRPQWADQTLIKLLMLSISLAISLGHRLCGFVAHLFFHDNNRKWAHYYSTFISTIYHLSTQKST